MSSRGSSERSIRQDETDESRNVRKGWSVEEQAAFWSKKRQERKARKRERSASAKEGKQREWESLTEEEQERRRAEAAEVHRLRKAKADAHEAACKTNANELNRPALLFDLAFWDVMKETGRKSTVSQLKFAYSSLKKAEFPLRPVMTSLDTADQYLAGLAAYEGFKAIPPVTSPKHWSEVVDQKASKVIYLSADSKNVLRKLEDNHTYIVGAFVDHNAKKGLTEENAQKLGVETARLPLDETIAVGNMCKVLTINHVTDVLVKFHETQSWEEAFKVLPTRRAN
jgi:tRNA (guanine9-N1)-methyltransferase